MTWLVLLTLLAAGLGLLVGAVAQRRLAEKRAHERTLAGRAERAARGVAGAATRKGLAWILRRRDGRSDGDS